MFNVLAKNKNNVRQTVYAVRQNKAGKTEFLIYEDSVMRWLWMDAELYKPEMDAELYKPEKENQEEIQLNKDIGIEEVLYLKFGIPKEDMWTELRTVAGVGGATTVHIVDRGNVDRQTVKEFLPLTVETIWEQPKKKCFM